METTTIQEPVKIVQQIRIDELNDHPRNSKIYNSSTPSEKLINSVREIGVSQNLIVSLRPNGAYVIVSGHRRKNAAFAVGLETVPCEVKTYESEDAEMPELIGTNEYREKTQEEINNEIKELNKAYRAQAKSRQLSGLQNVGNSDTYDENTAAGDLSPAGRTSEIIAAQMGVSKDEVKRRTTIHDDDSREKFLKKYRESGCTDAQEADLIRKWDFIRDKQNSEEITLGAAFVAIKELQEKVLPTSPKVSAKKPKMVKPATTPEERFMPCAEVESLHCGFIIDGNEKKVAVKSKVTGKVEIYEWENVLKHLVLPIPF